MQHLLFNNHKLSKLALGTVQFGLSYGVANQYGKPNDATVQEILDYVLSQGINLLDTADGYGDAHTRLGNTLKNPKPNIITKISSDIFLTNPQEKVTSLCHDLKTDSLFGLLLHDTKLLQKWQNSHHKIIEDLKQSHLIEYFGVSIYTNEEFELALNNESIVFIQIPFNIFDQRALQHNWFAKAQEKQKLLFIRSVFLQGLFLIPIDDLPPKLAHAKSYLETLHTQAQKFHLSLTQLALSFVNSVASDSILLFGCETLEQAQENIVNFKNLQPLNHEQILSLATIFDKVPEDIYLPTRW